MSSEGTTRTTPRVHFTLDTGGEVDVSGPKGLIDHIARALIEYGKGAIPSRHAAAPEGGAGSSPSGVDARTVLKALVMRVIDACAKAEGFQDYRSSDWSPEGIPEMIDRALASLATAHPPASEGAAGVPEGGERDEWLIWSGEHNAWWGPNGGGYTMRGEPEGLMGAGVYTRAEAEKWTRACGPEKQIKPIPLADMLAKYPARDGTVRARLRRPPGESPLGELHDLIVEEIRIARRGVAENLPEYQDKSAQEVDGMVASMVVDRLKLRRPTRSPEGSREVER